MVVACEVSRGVSTRGREKKLVLLTLMMFPVVHPPLVCWSRSSSTRYRSSAFLALEQGKAGGIVLSGGFAC